MAQSISKRQAQVLNTDYIDLLGEDSNNYAPASFPGVVDQLYNLALLLIESGQDELRAADKVSSGKLADSIAAQPMVIMGSVYSIDIDMASYYDFVNQGVNGWAKGYGSPYNFKKFAGKSGRKSGAMVTAIRKWLIREGLQSRAKFRPITERETKAKKITDTSTKTAIIISKAVRKNGIKPSHFWDRAVDKTELAAADIFGEAFKIDIINALHPRTK